MRFAIEVDRQLTIRELENNLGIPETTVWEILNKILGMTRVCAVTGFFSTITRQRIHRTLCSNFGWIVFERPLRGMNVNGKASLTYRLLADICRTYSSCAACFCLQSYFWVRRILWLLKMTEKQDQWICIKFCFQLGKTTSETIEMMQKAFGNKCTSKTRMRQRIYRILCSSFWVMTVSHCFDNLRTVPT